MEKITRQSIFISHATPGDNAFTTWLASRLSMAGYDVWCDQEKLLGGEDFWQDIEDELRNRTVKFVLVISQNAFDENNRIRDGIQKEVGLAGILKKQLGDDYFIIPMRIDNTSYSDFSIDFLRLNGIDCGSNWAVGLSQLLEALERDEIPHSDNNVSPSLAAWREVHQHHMRAISDDIELLQSNWLSIKKLPEEIYFYAFLGAIKSSEPRSIASSCSLPCFDHGRLIGSFAQHDELQTALGDAIPVKLRGSLKTTDFLAGETGGLLGIDPFDARNKLASIVRQAWNRLMEAKGLTLYEMSNGRLAWWFPDGIPEDGQLRFTDFNDKQRRRAVSGIKGKREAADGQAVPRYYWHLGFSAKPFFSEMPYIILQPRIIISENGKTPLANKTRLNSVRRSLTTMWFNDKWRTLVLGFSSWLADDNDEIRLPVSRTQNILVGGKPLMFESPVGIVADPVSFDLTDEIAERNEQAESFMRLSDPVFLKVDEIEEEKV